MRASLSMNDLDNPQMSAFVPRAGPVHDPQEYGEIMLVALQPARGYFAKGIYFWYSFGTWLRKRDGTVPVASDFSISCRCVMRVGFFLPAVAVFDFGSGSDGADDGADVV
jgi:hypothetical protein